MIGKKITISCTTGESFSLKIPKPQSIRSFYAFSMHKAGSSLLEKMLGDICRKLSIPVINPHAQAWRNGISTDTISTELENALKPMGYAYLGFRHILPLGMDVDLDTPKKILLVRDPRDMLTSLYFSHRHSHTKPNKHGSAQILMSESRKNASGKDINRFALENIQHYKNLFTGYKDYLLSLPHTRVYRYEDVIFDKEAWLMSMLDFYGFFTQYPKRGIHKQAAKISSRNDIRPTDENPNRHIRQVTPGNYKKHLSPDTLKILNSELADFLDYFNYS